MSSSIINRLPTVVAAQRLVRYSAASRCPELGLPADGRALHFPGLKHHWLIIERDTDAPGLKKLADRRSESLADMLDDLSNTSIPATPAALAYCLDAPAAICQHPTLSDERSLDWLGSQIRRREIAIHRYRPPKRMHRPPGRYRPTHVPTLEELDALHSESAAELDKAVGAVPAPELSTTESLPAPPPATIDQWSEKDMEIVRGLVQEQVAANPSLTEGYAQLLARLEVIGKAVALKNGAPVSSPEPAEQIVDATEPNVYKDPATAHCDDEPWRKAVVIDGVAQPFAKADGTPAGKPKRMPRYDERGTTVEREHNGKVYRVSKDDDGFPMFTIFETYLSDEHLGSKDERAHFAAANARLGALLREHPSLAERLGLTTSQQRFLASDPPKSTPPPRLTWHHHQDAGKMQLVNRRMHDRVAHVGGMQLWGGTR